MEIVAMELKMSGLFLARSLSYEVRGMTLLALTFLLRRNM